MLNILIYTNRTLQIESEDTLKSDQGNIYSFKIGFKRERKTTALGEQLSKSKNQCKQLLESNVQNK